MTACVQEGNEILASCLGLRKKFITWTPNSAPPSLPREFLERRFHESLILRVLIFCVGSEGGKGSRMPVATHLSTSSNCHSHPRSLALKPEGLATMTAPGAFLQPPVS